VLFIISSSKTCTYSLSCTVLMLNII